MLGETPTRLSCLRRLTIAAMLAFVAAGLLFSSATRAQVPDGLADQLYGQWYFETNHENLVERFGFQHPNNLAIDKSVTPHRLYIADTANNRIQVFAPK